MDEGSHRRWVIWSRGVRIKASAEMFSPRLPTARGVGLKKFLVSGRYGNAFGPVFGFLLCVDASTPGLYLAPNMILFLLRLMRA